LANERISSPSSTGIELDDWVDGVLGDATANTDGEAVEAVRVLPEKKALELGWVA
jgi:hypothetical protein